ncbi:hypothetical protein IAR50_004612 [Cryptococcus sp. DSM 104548]
MVKIFLTGASGYIGSHVTPILLAAGHKLTAIARSEASAKKLEDQGVTVVRASLEDTDALHKGAFEADAVIHLGFIHDFANFAKSIQVDHAAIEAFGKALHGTSKTLISTSGLLIGTSSEPTELTPANEAGRGNAEHLALSFAASGVRPYIVRLPPTVHGDGDQAFLTFYIQQSRKAGFAGYVGGGQGHWPAVHVKDAAQVYKLALESTSLQGGKVLHAAQDAGVPFKSIAEAVGKRLGVPTKSLTKEEAGEHYSWLAMFIAGDVVASSELTKEWLGWEPKEKAFLEEIEETGWYFTPEAVVKF